ncbi:hypothetical protein [Halovulum sp. GXIMD14793]
MTIFYPHKGKILEMAFGMSNRQTEIQMRVKAFAACRSQTPPATILDETGSPTDEFLDFALQNSVNLKAFRVYLETSHKTETRTPYRLITAFQDNLLSQVYPETL